MHEAQYDAGFGIAFEHVCHLKRQSSLHPLGLAAHLGGSVTCPAGGLLGAVANWQRGVVVLTTVRIRLASCIPLPKGVVDAYGIPRCARNCVFEHIDNGAKSWQQPSSYEQALHPPLTRPSTQRRQDCWRGHSDHKVRNLVGQKR